MEVSGQLRSPAALSPATGTHSTGDWTLWRRKKNLFPLTGIEPRFLSRPLIFFLVWHNIPMWSKASRRGFGIVFIYIYICSNSLDSRSACSKASTNTGQRKADTYLGLKWDSKLLPQSSNARIQSVHWLARPVWTMLFSCGPCIICKAATQFYKGVGNKQD
jgi:hypothetical protein